MRPRDFGLAAATIAERTPHRCALIAAHNPCLTERLAGEEKSLSGAARPWLTLVPCHRVSLAGETVQRPCCEERACAAAVRLQGGPSFLSVPLPSRVGPAAGGRARSLLVAQGARRHGGGSAGRSQLGDFKSRLQMGLVSRCLKEPNETAAAERRPVLTVHRPGVARAPA